LKEITDETAGWMISMNKQMRVIIIIVVIIAIALLLAGFQISGSVPENATTTNNSTVNASPVFNWTNFYVQQFPAETQNEVQSLAVEYSINLSYWGFDPLNHEINLYDTGVLDDSTVKELRKKKIGIYTIHVMNETEIQQAQDEVQNLFSKLRKEDPEYQIKNISMTPDLTVSPTRYYVELWCKDFTPENRGLEGKVIKGWRIWLAVPVS
jgi:hypothetical protein